MNNVQFMGHVVKDPEVRYSQSNQDMAIAKYSLAVKREFTREGEPDVDFINCVAFGKTGQFAEKYLRKGTKIVVTGQLRIGFYMKDNIRYNTADVIVQKHYFCASKAENNNTNNNSSNYNDSFNVPNSSSSTPGYAPIELSIDDLPF